MSHDGVDRIPNGPAVKALTRAAMLEMVLF